MITEHLELCDYKVCGYWDENDKFYEEITLPRPLRTELVSSSIGVTYTERWIQLKFVLKADRIASNSQMIGELILIYDENLEFVDENWHIDINSPFVVVKCQQQN